MLTSARAPSRSRRRNALLLILAYGAAIGAAAFLFVAQRVHSRHATFSRREFFWVGDLHEDAAMGFRMRSHRTGFAVLNHGVRDPARRIPVHTDQFGCRIPLGRDSTTVAPGGIAAIGCSCTFGHGVAAESSYVELAGSMLGVQAHNLGVCAYSAVGSLMRLQELLGPLQPHWVVYGFGNFHLERSARPRADFDVFQARARADGGTCRIEPPAFDNRAAFEAASGIESLYYLPRLAGRETPLDAARVRLLLPLALQDLGRAIRPANVRLRLERPALPETLFCRFLIDQMLDTCRQHGATFVLLYFPAFFGERPTPGLLAAVRDLRTTPDFVFVDASPRLFAGLGDQEAYAARWQVPRDGHPNRFMHLEMARALVDAITGAGGALREPPARSDERPTGSDAE